MKTETLDDLYVLPEPIPEDYDEDIILMLNGHRVRFNDNFGVEFID